MSPQLWLPHSRIFPHTWGNIINTTNWIQFMFGTQKILDNKVFFRLWLNVTSSCCFQLELIYQLIQMLRDDRAKKLQFRCVYDSLLQN
jgi:hypothetical protein